MAENPISTSDKRKNSPDIGNNGTPLALRRSGRARKSRVSPNVEDADHVNGSSGAGASKAPLDPIPTSGRRNPKRKVAREVFDVPTDLLEASLAPWQENEQAEWPSWTEVESDPAFFNRILDLIGVKQAKLQEVYSVDQESLAQLPTPVYGLIFLYQYVEGEPDSEAAESSPDLWFANQTTSNACATVALFNIIMNAAELELGDKLDKFKQESRDLSPPLRGNLLSNSSWIRVAHNSFARRLDLLNAALSLQNQVDDDKKKRRGKAAGSSRRKTKPPDEAGYHFIAFIPVKQAVWQLDGLQTNPTCIGEFGQGEHWTSVVTPVLEARMLQSEDEQLSFSLLAVHGSTDPMSVDESDEAVPGRKKDHTPAIHEWVKKLAEHGVLARLHEEAQLQNGL
ncbi:hypothetical protein B0H66DRAFT_607152 [Apodospora peruviana]|uniref:Ubiquitin carboxyl-terminal hydrolase n=1 Tax=Apodospora peruviana TaxID=516989 RepID=A0AAE0HVY6_9PEZI|nr:hypothetical protein B0H66DRAFT_607152 [Apodospora peruviana]